MFQSEVISMVASVLSARHSALKVFLDHCVVMLESDTAATPSCDFIKYHGSEPHLTFTQKYEHDSQQTRSGH